MNKILKLENYVDQSAMRELAKQNVEAVYNIGKTIEKPRNKKDKEPNKEPEASKSRFEKVYGLKVGDKVRVRVFSPYIDTDNDGKIGIITKIGTTNWHSVTGCHNTIKIDTHHEELYADLFELVTE